MSERRSSSARALSGHSVTNLFVFFLIGLFAVLAVTLTLIGIRAYRSLSEASVENSEGQIALSYLLGKVHSADRAGAVSLDEQEGVAVLTLRETVDGDSYETRIFFSDGELREYFCEEGELFDSGDGEALCTLSALRMQMETPGLLRVETVQPDGREQSLHIALRAGEVQP